MNNQLTTIVSHLTHWWYNGEVESDLLHEPSMNPSFPSLWIDFVMKSHLNLYVWLFVCMYDSLFNVQLIDIKFNMVSEQIVRSWFTIVPVWIKIVSTCRVLLVAHMWESVLEYESEFYPTLNKHIQSLWRTSSIVNWFWNVALFELICMIHLFKACLIDIKFDKPWFIFDVAMIFITIIPKWTNTRPNYC